MKDLFGNETEDIVRTAHLSPCGVYRYRLTRSWNAALPVAHWIMLNPSTADAMVDDPTIRRCMGFARSFGCGGIDVRNLFAFRATSPTAVWASPDPVGTINDAQYLYSLVERSPGPVIAAWGCDGQMFGRAKKVTAELSRLGVELHCLGVTKDGHPRHPLYIKSSQELVPFGR